jgi:GMP synthase-like glutamine amidotransferase
MPILGLCYGAQLVSRALGGAVAPAAAPEIGWQRVESEGPELASMWFEWHSDAFTVPQEKVEVRSRITAALMSSPDSLAIYVARKTLYGVFA